MTENSPEFRPSSEITLYTAEDGGARIQVLLEDETVWLTQSLMAELFQTSPQNITIHIKTIYEDGELFEEATCKKYLQVQTEGDRAVQRRLKHYNLEMILAVGYRVRSHRGVQFRQWATERLRQYLVKGFAIDDERLKEGRNIGADYFDELLERIRDIRASEKRFYQKIRDIYKLAVDYNPKAEGTREFFQIVQNKLHWAITGKTAAELIQERADPSQPNMGLTSWKGAKVRKGDVVVAKNYLNQGEIDELNRIIVMYLDFAEDQSRRRRRLYMRDWREKLDAFLQFNERDILEHAGHVSMAVAKALVQEKYEQYNQRRLVEEAAAEDAEEAKVIEELGRQIEDRRKELGK